MNGLPGAPRERRRFDLFSNPARDFIDDVTRFSDFGGRTVVETVDGVPYFTNEFWTSRQRQAHRIHEVSYRACFKPQLPAFFIERLTRPGDVVHDPFMGRGTTPIEAAILGRVPYGNDINPLSAAMVPPRVETPTLGQVARRLSDIPWDEFPGHDRDDLLAFYHPVTLSKIEGLRAWLLEREARGPLDSVDSWIRMVAINRLTGHSPGFLSVYTLPPNQATSVERQIGINEKRNQTPPFRDVPGIVLKKSKSLLGDGGVTCHSHRFTTGPSHDTPAIGTGEVSLTVTSPPFLDIVSYESDNWLRCWFIGVDPATVNLSKHRDVGDWRDFVAATLKELERVTKVGGHIAFEVGEVRNGRVKLEENVIEATAGLSLDILGVLVNDQDFTKTSNCWGVSNNVRGTNSNRIVVMRRVR